MWLHRTRDGPEILHWHGLAPEQTTRGGISLVVHYLRSLVDTMMAAHDRLYIGEKDFDRTIAIDTLGVGTTEFDPSSERAMELYESGRTAAGIFLSTIEEREGLLQL